MKRFLLLVASALLIVGSASAQKKWTNQVTNGNAEGEQDPAYSSFWVHDWRQGVEFQEETGQSYSESGQFNGFAEIVEDPDNPSNHCYRVIVRSTAEAEAAGNMISADGKMAGWDSQFFVAVPENLPSGKEYRLSMKVKADKSGPSSGTQAHGAPGDYHYWSMCGTVNYTTEWVTFEAEGTLDDNQAYNENKTAEGFRSIAFNLSDYADGYIAYFDDIKFEVRDPQEIDPSESSTTINFLRNGTDSADKIGNYTTFTGRYDGIDSQARFADDPVDGKPALYVTTIAYNNTVETPVYDTDEDGNILYDEDGNPIPEIDEGTNQPKMEVVYVREVKDEETGEMKIVNRSDDNSKLTDWSSQFFVTVPHKFVSGEPYSFKMFARASKDVTVDTQSHRMPGDYQHYNFCNSLNLTTEWQEFSFGSEEEPVTVPSEAKGCQTIAFNCNKDTSEPITIYFRFEDFSFGVNTVKANERILGSESIILPVKAGKDSEVTATIDMNEAVKVLDVDDFDGLISDDPVRVKNIDPETDDEVFDEVQLTAGVYINEEGNNTEDDSVNSIYCEQDDDTTKDGVLGLKIQNNGVEIEKGKSIDTKIVIEKDSWYYVYNVSFLDSEVYSSVSSIDALPTSSVIYNVAGQRVDSNYKGIVIKNGKKFLNK